MRKNAALVIVDLLSLPCLIVVLPFPWRSGPVVKSVTSFKDVIWSKKLRDCIIEQFFGLFSDFLHLILAILVACSVYPSLYSCTFSYSLIITDTVFIQC
jgi:hypothetical protein